MKKKFYTLSIVILAVITLVVLLLSLLHIGDDSIFNGITVVILLAVTALLTILCICAENVGGRFLRKSGFYLLHGGLAVLLIGFLLGRFFVESYTVPVPVGSNSYRYVVDEVSGKETDLGIFIGVTDTVTEYYTDDNGNPTENPKYYEATLSLTDPQTLSCEEQKLTVNHPLRITGNRKYKVYLMHIYTDSVNGLDMAVLLLKSDPSEITVLTGIVLLIAGSVFMCLPFFRRRREKGGETDA